MQLINQSGGTPLDQLINEDGYWGINGSLGIGTVTAAGAEFHGGYSRTVAITEQFNVVERIISLF